MKTNLQLIKEAFQKARNPDISLHDKVTELAYVQDAIFQGKVALGELPISEKDFLNLCKQTETEYYNMLDSDSEALFEKFEAA